MVDGLTKWAKHVQPMRMTQSRRVRSVIQGTHLLKSEGESSTSLFPSWLLTDELLTLEETNLPIAHRNE